jgi:hypothetical protein
MADDYQRALEKAQREYEALVAERTRLDERLARLSQTIGSLMRLCNITPSVTLGLTDACRTVLKAAEQALAGTEVRQRLAAMGFDVDRYASDLASIHTVLKRLCRAGELDFVPRAEGGPAYRWHRPVRVVALTREDAALILGQSVVVPGAPRRKG